MNKKVKLIWTFVLLVVILVGGYVFYSSQQKNMQTGGTQGEIVPAIDFNVQNKNGTNTYLSDFNDGKPIVINFWSSQCGPCVQEMPDFQRLYDDYKDRVHFVMIDSIGALGETKESGKAFIEKHQYTFPVFYDVNKNAQQSYGVRSLPTTYLINKNFEIIRGGSGMINYDLLAGYLDEVLGE